MADVTLLSQTDDEWVQVFGALKGQPFGLADVAEPIASVVVEGDYAETELWAVVRLKDGRFGYIHGGCDTTGWDCQSSADGFTADTVEAIIAGLDDEAMRRLCGVDRLKGVDRG